MFVACKPFVIVWAFDGTALFLIGSIFFVNYHRSRTEFFSCVIPNTHFSYRRFCFQQINAYLSETNEYTKQKSFQNSEQHSDVLLKVFFSLYFETAFCKSCTFP